MLYIGLTGNIASGKTEVARLFAPNGATIIDADLLAREAVAPGTRGLQRIVDRWGAGILMPNGTLDRAALRHLVFGDREQLNDLNAILHPEISALRDLRLAEARARAVSTELAYMRDTMAKKAPGSGQRSQRRPMLLSDLSPESSEVPLINVVIETPKGSSHKLDYDPTLGTFRLQKVLPQGMVFPFDFGFIPGTLADDGDPEDVLLLLEAPLFPGIVVPARLIGVIEAVQTDRGGPREENDRLIAVAPACPLYADVHALSDVPKTVVDQIQQFFVTYNTEYGKEFTPKGQHGPKRAAKCLREARKRFQRQQG